MEKITEACTQNKTSQEIKNHVSAFDRTLQKSETWIGNMHKQLHWLSADAVYHLLRAVLQTIRDQLNANEAAHFSSQLPLLLRGSFYECWDPKLKTKGMTKQEFLETVQEKLGNTFQPKFDLEKSTSVALSVIMSHVSPNEIKDIMAAFKPSLKEYFEKCSNKVS